MPSAVPCWTFGPFALDQAVSKEQSRGRKKIVKML
jgi:hypothetical protein